MDSITHLTQKLLAERARQQPNNAPPPPYSSHEEEEEEDSESDDSSSSPHPISLTLNATTTIHGSNNLAPTSSSPLADATKFSALLLHAINRINAANAGIGTGTVGPSGKQLKVDLTINCGVTIVGDRNVVGNVGIKPRGAQTAVVGVKRRVEEDVGEEQPAVKVVKTEA